MHRPPYLILPMLLASLVVFAVPAHAATALDLGQIMNQYQMAASGFGASIKPVAWRLGLLLATIWIALTALNGLLKGDGSFEIGIKSIRTIMWVGLVNWLIFTPSAITDIVNGFIKLGQLGANTSIISPSDVLYQGIDLVDKISTAFSSQASMLDIFPALLMAIQIAIILLTFAYLAAQFALIYIEFWFFLAVAPIGFAISMTPWTKSTLVRMCMAPVSYGMKFLVLYFIVSVATKMMPEIGSQLTGLSIHDLTPLWTVTGGSIVLLLLAMKAPQMASDILNGTASLSAGDGVGGAMVAAGTLATGGAAALGTAKAAGIAGGGLTAAAQVGKAGLQAAGAQGATGMVGRTAAAGSAIGTATGQVVSESVRKLGSGSTIGRIAQRVADNAAGGISAPAPSAPPAPPAPSTPSAPKFSPLGTRPGQGSAVHTAMFHAQQMGVVQQQPGAPEIPSEEA